MVSAEHWPALATKAMRGLVGFCAPNRPSASMNLSVSRATPAWLLWFVQLGPSASTSALIFLRSRRSMRTSICGMLTFVPLTVSSSE